MLSVVNGRRVYRQDPGSWAEIRTGGNKKRVSSFHRTARPPALATFPSWGIRQELVVKDLPGAKIQAYFYFRIIISNFEASLKIHHLRRCPALRNLHVPEAHNFLRAYHDRLFRARRLASDGFIDRPILAITMFLRNPMGGNSQSPSGRENAG